MPNDSFFKNVQDIEKFLKEKNSILKDEQEEKTTSEWIQKHHEYIKEQSINPFRYYAAIFHRDPRVIKMLTLAEKLNKKMQEFKDDKKYSNEELDNIIDQCNKFLYEFGNACGYFTVELDEDKKYNITEYYNMVTSAKHSERYSWLKQFETNLNNLKKAKCNKTTAMQTEKIDINSKNIKKNNQIILDEFKKDILPKIESTAITIYKPPISENFKQNKFEVSYDQKNNLSFVKELTKNNNKNSTALTIWKPPLSQQFENAEQLRQYVVKNLPEIKKILLKENINSDKDVPIKQFIVKNFSEIKNAFSDTQTIKRSNTFKGKSAFKDSFDSDNKPSKKEETSNQIKSTQQNKKEKNNDVTKLEHSDDQIRNEDKIAVKDMDLNSVSITYYRALVRLFQDAKNGFNKYTSDLAQKIRDGDLIKQFENLKEFNSNIEELCKKNAGNKPEIKISIMKAIKQEEIIKDKLEKWKSYFKKVKEKFHSIAFYICNKTKKDNKEEIYNELWEKTATLINFKSQWANASTKELFEYNKKSQNPDNIKCLKILYYLRRIFEILDKSANEYKNKKK